MTKAACDDHTFQQAAGKQLRRPLLQGSSVLPSDYPPGGAAFSSMLPIRRDA